ncbi:MAG: 16S rRNA (cytosine(1402)-N(4))-methyltransferase RsmH, partial [Oscillospiraceae bacterium]|nr:16S rRNA (cytosine(1402)-N(4))-methyltransferase RsmH [Oscillospiraceae bacterium]
CVDQDAAAIEDSRRRLAPHMDRVTLVQSNFRHLGGWLRRFMPNGVDGVLFDLGVSSPQLDKAERGFSYHKDAPLDMRMDTGSPFTARVLVNSWSKEQLERVIREYGEERYAGRIAHRIVTSREAKPVETTLELAEIVKKALPPKALRESQHPAMRTFQAIRIAVNDELDALADGLEASVSALKPGGRLAVISFHSLEDRIVKRAFLKRGQGCTCPPDFPACVCGFKPDLKILTRQPIVAGKTELTENRRARSAKLRVAEKI